MSDRSEHLTAEEAFRTRGWDTGGVYHGPDKASPQPVRFKPLDVFLNEYVPLAYTIEPYVRSGSLYCLTAKTGAGKTAWEIMAALSIATGRADILGLNVEQGRVAFLTIENPDDTRMRIKIAAWLFQIDPSELAQALVVLDHKEKPEDITAELKSLSMAGEFKAIFVDTLAAFYDGQDINNNVEAGNFMRRLRPLTQLSGLPAVIVAAHPVKSATEENLLPYGGGAILNECDGNLTLWRKAESGNTVLHWQGKIRGLEFQPISYRFEIASSPDVLDAKGRQVQLPYLATVSAGDEEQREAAELDVSRQVLRLIAGDPTLKQREIAIKVGRSLAVVNGKIAKLKRDKLVEDVLGKLSVTAKGQKALEN